jgi:hypothetical protein
VKLFSVLSNWSEASSGDLSFVAAETREAALAAVPNSYSARECVGITSEEVLAGPPEEGSDEEAAELHASQLAWIEAGGSIGKD